MNERILTVKGIGNVAAKPDLVVITMNLTVTMPEYAQTMECAAKEIEAMRQALISIGYEQAALKTTDFNISTEYESYKDSNGNYQRRFVGYKCSHALKLEFEFDMKRLGETLTAISTCGVTPEFQIAFSVKDKNAVSAALLESAISNAKEKAAIISKTAGVTLGAIQGIDYSWGELRLFSETRFSDAICCSIEAAPIDIEPDDIDVNDSVTVVWAIEETAARDVRRQGDE
jgi:uncharacterized protein YggE